MATDVLKQCYNKGCGQKYKEEDNKNGDKSSSTT